MVRPWSDEEMAAFNARVMAEDMKRAKMEEKEEKDRSRKRWFEGLQLEEQIQVVNAQKRRKKYPDEWRVWTRKWEAVKAKEDAIRRMEKKAREQNEKYAETQVDSESDETLQLLVEMSSSCALQDPIVDNSQDKVQLLQDEYGVIHIADTDVDESD